MFRIDKRLDPSIEIGDVDEVALAHIAKGGDSSGDFHFQLFFEIFAQSARAMRGFKFLTERIDSEFTEFFQLFPTEFQQLTEIFRLRRIVFF